MADYYSITTIPSPWLIVDCVDVDGEVGGGMYDRSMGVRCYFLARLSIDFYVGIIFRK